ncbi:hypothetical protein SCHPADRAFT_323545 [Schizopora paradoxa]|uniref:Secreted protein n=1 Tax=Schizopora paradoxa TaxID=27342 RepID=A0A0H2SBL7_9AGAM|nr:hypothetical protein SCHPADRAFT_323545 [Schizopora paradoxa]
MTELRGCRFVTLLALRASVVSCTASGIRRVDQGADLPIISFFPAKPYWDDLQAKHSTLLAIVSRGDSVTLQTKCERISSERVVARRAMEKRKVVHCSWALYFARGRFIARVFFSCDLYHRRQTYAP